MDVPRLSAEELRLLINAASLADEHGPLVVLDDATADASTLSSHDLGAEPCIVIGVDVLLREADDLARIRDTVSLSPRASVAAAVLLRGAHVGARDERIARESAVYSLLQGGPEFRAWRASRAPRVLPPEDPDQVVLVERRGNELVVTLNRPDRSNAVTRALRDGLTAALRVALLDPEVSVMLQANGPNFCTGGDLDEFGSFPDPASSHVVRLTRSPARMLALLADRTCTYVHGTCAGSGIELAAFAGRVVADPSTTFRLPELPLGLIPGAGGTVSITDRIGAERTLWLLLTGRVIDAPTALAWGLVDAVERRP